MDNNTLILLTGGYAILSSLLVYASLYFYSKYAIKHSIVTHADISRAMVFISFLFLAATSYAFYTDTDDIYTYTAMMMAFTVFIITLGYTRVPFDEASFPVIYYVSSFMIIIFVATVYTAFNN